MRAKLGSPSATSTFDPNIWFYINQIDRARRLPPARRWPQRNVTAITFDKDTETGRRRSNTYALKDGKVIAFNGRETPTRGRELTILEQLLGNVGRGACCRAPTKTSPASAARASAKPLAPASRVTNRKRPGDRSPGRLSFQAVEAVSRSRRSASTASSSRATMLVILIIGFTAGPEVSL